MSTQANTHRPRPQRWYTIAGWFSLAVPVIIGGLLYLLAARVVQCPFPITDSIFHGLFGLLGFSFLAGSAGLVGSEADGTLTIPALLGTLASVALALLAIILWVLAHVGL